MVSLCDRKGRFVMAENMVIEWYGEDWAEMLEDSPAHAQKLLEHGEKLAGRKGAAMENIHGQRQLTVVWNGWEAAYQRWADSNQPTRRRKSNGASASSGFFADDVGGEAYFPLDANHPENRGIWITEPPEVNKLILEAFQKGESYEQIAARVNVAWGVTEAQAQETIELLKAACKTVGGMDEE